MKKSSIFPQQVSKLVKAQMELYSQPSFEAFNQLLIQYIQGEGPECIQKLQLFFFKQYIEVIDKFFINQQLYCLMELPCHPEPKDNICYTCRVCRKESNAIMCHPCFLKSDHSGHSDEVIQRNYEKGSSCDCGDDTKWNPDGFCSSHQWHPDMSDISEECYKVKQDYRIKTSYFLKILFVLYQLLLEVKKNEKIGIQAVLEQKLDGFGNKLLQKLLQCNKNRRKIIKQTQIILMHKINLKKCPTQSQNITLLDCLMSFIELKQKTISNCVDLIVLPFYRNQPFRQMVTLKYFERYSQYSLTYYQIRFSSILFANSLLISKLTQKKILKKFIFKKKVSDVVRGDLRQKIYFVIYSHIQYFVDSVFFTDLQPNCAVNYWNHFNNLGGFAEIANYCQSFQAQKQLLIVNNQFYHIEYNFLIKIIKTFELMFNMNQIGFFKQVIFQLFQKITSKSEQKKSQSNLFFSYERIWTIAVYLFLMKNKQSTFLHDNTQDNKKIEKQQLKSLYHTLKFQSLRYAHQKFKLLFEKLLDYIQKIDKISLSLENKPYNKFIVYYYGSNNLLASLDTILFQIIIKMMNYISEIDKENNKAKKQQPNNSLPKKKTYINTIDHTISRRVLEMGQQILKEIGKVAQNDNKMKKMAQKKDEPYLPQREQYLQEISLKIQIFWSFIMRLSQSIYSDIPDLHLSTYFSKMRSRNQYKSKYQSYYINLLASINGESISIKDFHYFAKILFFQQASSFQQFLRDFQDKNNKWISKKIVNKMNIMPVDIFAHMGTLKRKMQLKIIQKRLISNIVLKPPFLYKTKNQPYHLSFSLVNNYAMMIVKDLLKKNLIQTQWLTILCCKLIKQVWKISQYCDSLLATKYLYQLYYHEKINGQLQSNNYLNNNTQKYIDFFPDELIQYLSQLPLNTMDREFLLDQTIKQEQSHEDFYKNQQQEQQQFLQQENQYQHLEQLNSSLQKRINNAMNNSQYNSNSLKPYIGQKEKHCSICKMIDLKVQKLCYVSYTYVPRIFDLKPQSRYISFSSCEHFFHKQCIQKHQKMSQYKQCPQCNNFYNILLLSEQDLYRPFLGKAEVYIQPFFEKICSVAFDKQQVLKHQIKQFYLQIVKSAIIFFLMASTKDRQQFNQMNIHTYLYLIQILKVYFMPQEKDYNQNYQVQFLLLKNSQYRTLFDYLNKVIWSNILTHKKFDYESYENIPISKQQANLIDALLYCAFKQHFFPSIAEFQQKQTFVSYKLPQKLQQLSHSKLKCSCQENGQIVTMICLLHQHPSKETCCCKNCHKKFIQNHILTHKDQIITIETYTGTIIFYKKHYKKLWTISGGNIYLDMEKEFVIKNNADYQDKLDKRLNDELNKAQYQEILFKFYSQEFFINGKLKPIQFNIDHI